MKIAITGGAGYVGSALVPRLIQAGHNVTVLDTFWFGDFLPKSIYLTKIKGDIRIKGDLSKTFAGQDVVIHLACVSNDPCFEMNPNLGRSVNYDCFKHIVDAVRSSDVGRFIYASSSSVYGVSDLDEVTEEVEKKPLTDYSRYKLACEVALNTYGTGGEWAILRPATVCGYSPRMRLDLVVNILTMQALTKREITIFGTTQKRPNIHIEDMCRAYLWAVDADKKVINEQTFNVGFENMSLLEIAKAVKRVVGREDIIITEKPVNDPRSYHISSKKITEAGFHQSRTVSHAINSVKEAFWQIDTRDTRFNNIKRMQELGL